jgi:hypothetical protein
VPVFRTPVIYPISSFIPTYDINGAFAPSSGGSLSIKLVSLDQNNEFFILEGIQKPEAFQNLEVVSGLDFRTRIEKDVELNEILVQN